MNLVLRPIFVEFIPEELEDGKIYISQIYATAVHNCCACGEHKVVTPLSDTGWKLIVDRGLVTLYPSIGNWSFPCQSHYWIKRNRVHWSFQMSKLEIEAGRHIDAELKQQYFQADSTSTDHNELPGKRRQDPNTRETLWHMLKKWLFR